ncbi:MAG: hypothetical protein JSV09_08670 [Thermoplasmata archaeon]|nr:MAG: hypothetical protein JSV09_08670 [Thermoplasmata archaeon]
MKNLTVPDLLSRYQRWVETGEIQFLTKGSYQQERILKLLEEIHSDFTEAQKKGSISDNLDWQKAHKTGRDLWHELASSALNAIDAGSKGNSKLFQYLDAATNFEDTLYGLEDYYRDHTLHSLWVYFIGEHILRDHLPEKQDSLNWYLFNDIESETSLDMRGLLAEAREREEEICEKVNNRRDAIWCLMALCHDLGYSLAKLDKLNEKVQGVLDFFDIPRFRRIGYTLDVEHHYIASQFLELMAMDVRIVPSSDAKQVLIKCYRDDSTYWRLCRALEKKQHGILSSYLIYKILGIFADTSVRGPAEEWGLEDEEAVDNIIRGDILYAIAQHEFDFAHLDCLNSLADILIIADQLEEFSRYGRPMLTRKYHDTTAEASIAFDRSSNGKDIDICVGYEVAEHHNLSVFFKRKAEELCKFYSLKQSHSEMPGKRQVYAIKSIKMTAEQNEKKHFIQFFRDLGDKAFLPAVSFEEQKLSEGEYPIECIDDKIYVEYAKGKKMSLDEWFDKYIKK